MSESLETRDQALQVEMAGSLGCGMPRGAQERCIHGAGTDQILDALTKAAIRIS